MKKKMYINSMGYYKHIITSNYHNYCRDVTSVDFRVKEVRNRKKNLWKLEHPDDEVSLLSTLRQLSTFLLNDS